MRNTHNALFEQTVHIAKLAGSLIMQVYEGELGVRLKGDGSPVTIADSIADEAIVRELRKLTPDIPIISEEGISTDWQSLGKHPFWLVDPLDGTKEFISKNGQFTVNIALIEAGQPILGVVYAPALDQLYGGNDEGAFLEEGDYRRVIECRTMPVEGVTVVGSRSHGDAAALDQFLQGQLVNEIIPVGSSLKLCLIAEGKADLYPRFGRTMEWDIAAGHAVLLAAGGLIKDFAGQPLSYGKPHFENPHFLASSNYSSVF